MVRKLAGAGCCRVTPGRSSLGSLDPVTSLPTAPAGTLRLTAWVFAVGLLGLGVLGWLLTEEDFGIYGIAIGTGATVYALRGGGVATFLVERGRYASPNLHANAVWYSLGVSLVAALALTVLAPIGGWLFGEGSVRSILLLAATSVPLGFFAPVARALLQTHGAARTAELVDGSAIAAHFGLAAVFAALDFGAASFVVPLLVINPLLSLVGWALFRRLRIPFGRASTRGVIRIARRSRPAVTLAAVDGATRHGPLAALALATSVEVIGFYYFAYRLAMGSVLWLTAPVRWFLVPTFASMHGDPWRRRRAALDAFLVASLLIGTVPLFLAALAWPLEAFVWRGRWQEAVFSIAVLGVAMAVEVVVVVALMLFQSHGAFRLRVRLLAGRGAGLLIVMGLAGWLAESVDALALAAGGYLVASGSLVVAYVLKAMELSRKKIGRAVASVYLLTGSATLLAWLTELALADAFSWVQLGVAAVTFLLVVFVGGRTFFESQLRRAATVIERTTGNRHLQRMLRTSAAQSDPVT